MGERPPTQGLWPVVGVRDVENFIGGEVRKAAANTVADQAEAGGVASKEDVVARHCMAECRVS